MDRFPTAKHKAEAKISGLTKSQRENIEEFLHLFADVEVALKKRLCRRANDPTGVGMLINDYILKNPGWTDSGNQLRNLADIRNLLTHQRSTALGYPIAVAPFSLKLLRDLKNHLLNPKTVSEEYCRSVKTVAPDDSIAFVLSLAYENGFSQFPVVSSGRFNGLITENEIVRWLGRETTANSAEVNLSAVSVRMILKEKDPYLKDMAIFYFEKLDAPVQEVMGRFSAKPALEAVLLTINGNGNAPIEGIITQWDAARYLG